MKGYSWIIALVSGVVVAAEITLTRVFAYLIWYHGVFLILSLAMLGFAASGAVLTLGGRCFRERADQWIQAALICFSLFLVFGILLPSFFTLDIEEVSLQNRRQLFYLAFYFVYWGGAFMMAGGAIALILQHRRERIHQLYFASMVGSGLGCLLALGLLYLGPVVTLCVLSILALTAALVVSLPSHRGIFYLVAQLVILTAMMILTGLIRTDWKVAPSKWEFHQNALNTIERTNWSPISVVQVFNQPHPGWRYWDTGLSIHHHDLSTFPQQKGIIIDAYAMSAFTRWDGEEMRSLDFFADAATSAAYLLTEKPRVLVIGIGGGIDILRALYFGAESVVGIELNGILIDLLGGPYRAFTGDLAGHPQVRLVKDEGRSFVKHTSEQFDIIQLNYTDTWSASSSGALSLAENFIYTADAIRDYYRRLSERGILSLTRTLSSPYRETLRLTLTAMKALRELGISEPRRHLLAVAAVMANAPQPHMSATLLVSKQPFTPAQVARVLLRGQDRWLMLFRPDGGVMPGWEPDQTLFRPESASAAPTAGELILPARERYYRGALFPSLRRRREPEVAAEAVAERQWGKQYYDWANEKIDEARSVFSSFMTDFPDDTSALETYEFDVSPLTDDRPFYYYYYRWKQVWEHILEGAFSIDAGGPFLLIALFLALGGSAVGIFLPLAVWQLRRKSYPPAREGGKSGWYGLYFLGLGLGYILIELNLMQKYALFLGHPIYALGTVLGGLLILSGLGSYLSRKITWRRRTVLVLLSLIITCLFGVMFLPPYLMEFLAGRPAWLRASATLAVIAPLGLLMGMPFPLGLKLAGEERPHLIPWMWGVNGFGSVIGSILATVIAISFGYNAVSLSAAAAYALALIGGVVLAGGGRKDSFERPLAVSPGGGDCPNSRLTEDR